MDQQQYQWRRYLCPRSDSYAIDDHGFLLSPARSILFAVNQTLVSPQELLQHRCAVLLGEAGIGKTTILQQIAAYVEEALTGADRICEIVDLGSYESSSDLRSSLRENEKIVLWKSGENHLILVLDSLDEALLRFDTVGDVLLQELSTLPLNRLQLFIACRASEWQPSFERDLVKRFQPQEMTVFNVTQLSKNDVKVAAAAADLDPDRFIDDVIGKGIGPLAAHPITLKFLLNIYQRNKGLPAARHRHDVYLQGCLLLCSEVDDSRRRVMTAVSKSDAQQRFNVAAKVAVVLVFCNCTAVWTGIDLGDKPVGSLSYQELTTGFQALKDRGGESLSEAQLNDALATGLFVTKGVKQVAFAHQSYAEFLAAYFIEQLKISLQHLIELFQVPGRRRVMIQPQLQEVAAWLTIQSSELRRVLIQCAPELVLRGDPTLFADAEKVMLTRALLDEAEQPQSLPIYSYRNLLRRLKNGALPEILRIYLSDKQRVSHATRRLALQIAEECRVRTLCEELISLSLSESEEFDIRFLAASAAGETCGDTAALRLKPLAVGIKDDINDELKGTVLQRLWPGTISTSEMFSILTPPHKKSYIGRYRWFIHVLPERLEEGDVPAALSWAEQQRLESDTGEFDDLVGNILSVALQHVTIPDVRSSVVRLILSRAEKRGSIFARTSVVARNSVITGLAAGNGRYLLTRDLIKQATHLYADPLWALDSVCREGLITGDDFHWLVKEWQDSTDEQYKQVVLRLVFVTWDRTSEVHNELLGAAAATSAELRAITESYLVALSRHASSASTSVRAGQDHGNIPISFIDSPVERHKRVTELLSRSNAAVDQLWVVTDRMLAEAPRGDGSWTSRYYPPPHESPVWSLLDDAAKNQVLDTAQEFVQLGTSDKFELRVAGFRALWLLLKSRRIFIDILSQQIWTNWISAILDYPHVQLEDFESAYSELLKRAYEAAPEVVIEKILQLVEDDASSSVSQWTRCVAVLWNQRIQECLERQLARPSLPTSTYENLAMELLAHNSSSARAAVTLNVEAASDVSGIDERALASGRAILLREPIYQWGPLLRAIRQLPHWGEQLFLSAAYDLDQEAVKRLKDTPVSILRDLYMWLTEHFPEAEDPQHDGVYSPGPRDEIADFRNLVLRELTSQGTQEAYVAISDIADRFPELEWTGQEVFMAEQKAISNDWKPLAPNQLLQRFLLMREGSSSASKPLTKGWALAGLSVLIGLLAACISLLTDLVAISESLCATVSLFEWACAISPRSLGSLLLLILLTIVGAVLLAVEMSSEIREVVIGYSDCQLARPVHAQRYPQWFRWSLWILVGIVIAAMIALTIWYPW